MVVTFSLKPAVRSLLLYCIENRICTVTERQTADKEGAAKPVVIFGVTAIGLTAIGLTVTGVTAVGLTARKIFNREKYLVKLMSVQDAMYRMNNSH